MTALDLFPFEAHAGNALPIQGRILLRRSAYRLSVRDIDDFIASGAVLAQDDADQAQEIAANGF